MKRRQPVPKSCDRAPKPTQRWSLRCSRNGGSTKAPRRLGAQVRPGSESTTRAHWGSLGTWEVRQRPCLDVGEAWANPVNNARFGEGLSVLCPHRSQEQTGSGQGMIGQFAQTESQSNKLGRLSGLIVPLPGQANSHQRSQSEGRGLPEIWNR